MKPPPGKLDDYGDCPPRLIRGFNLLREFAIASQPQAGLGLKSHETSGGTLLSLSAQTPAASGGAVQQFILVAMFEDYFTAHKYTDSGPGSETIQIAKPYKLRKTPWASGSHNIIIEDGTASPPSVPVFFTYLTNTYRRVSTGTTDEDQVIIPQYRVGDIIYATEPIGGTRVDEGDGPLTWLDINADGRAWSKV